VEHGVPARLGATASFSPGGVSGQIVAMTEQFCVLRDDQGHEYAARWGQVALQASGPPAGSQMTLQRPATAATTCCVPVLVGQLVWANVEERGAGEHCVVTSIAPTHVEVEYQGKSYSVGWLDVTIDAATGAEAVAVMFYGAARHPGREAVTNE